MATSKILGGRDALIGLGGAPMIDFGLKGGGSYKITHTGALYMLLFFSSAYLERCAIYLYSGNGNDASGIYPIKSSDMVTVDTSTANVIKIDTSSYNYISAILLNDNRTIAFSTRTD